VSGQGMVVGATYPGPFTPFFFPLAVPFPLPVACKLLLLPSVILFGIAFSFLFDLSVADLADLHFLAAGGCH